MIVALLTRLASARQRTYFWIAYTALAASVSVGTIVAQANDQQATEPAALHAKVGYLSFAYTEPEPLSLVDKVLTDKGLQGARIGIAENNITGRLLGNDYVMTEKIVPQGADVLAAAKELISAGVTLILADLETADLIRVADMAEMADAVLFNVRSSDVRLRHELCRKNVFHIPPDWSMRADALAQYLVWKKWRNWALISGERPEDIDFTDALRRAAKRFGAKIVGEKTYAYQSGSRRTDTGHQQIQTQMPLLTQGFPDHDVIIASDISESFGDYLLYRTFEPRPVAGSHGLTAVTWHRSYEESGGTQMQNRFEKKAGRTMTERDYSGWLAARTLGEAVTRTQSIDPKVVRAYLMSEKFEVAGFKSQGLNFRHWDRQLRQPILLAGPRALVSISPQEGFLHPKYLTDTLGYDEPETKCTFKN